MRDIRQKTKLKLKILTDSLLKKTPRCCNRQKIFIKNTMNITTSSVRDFALGATGVAALAAMWVYNKMITVPLRTFYFVGPWWRNAPLSEICFKLTNIDSKNWEMNNQTQTMCRELTEREFESWDATVLTTLYFTALTFGTLQLCCSCFVIRPIVHAFNPSKK
jgi:hypothetical protein